MGKVIQPHTVGLVSDRPEVVYARAAERATYFAVNNKTLRYCAEPMPDVSSDVLASLTIDSTHNGEATIGYSGTNVNIKNDNKLNAGRELKNISKEMAGRSQLVLLSRELLYRIYELSLNFETNFEQAAKQYIRVINVIDKLADATKADAATAEKNAAASKANAEAAKLKEEAALEKIKTTASAQAARANEYLNRFVALVSKVDNKEGECLIDKNRLNSVLDDKRLNGRFKYLSGTTKCSDLRETLQFDPEESVRLLMTCAEPGSPK
jgi:hypothetical protein